MKQCNVDAKLKLNSFINAECPSPIHFNGVAQPPRIPIKFLASELCNPRRMHFTLPIMPVIHRDTSANPNELQRSLEKNFYRAIIPVQIPVPMTHPWEYISYLEDSNVSWHSCHKSNQHSTLIFLTFLKHIFPNISK